MWIVITVAIVLGMVLFVLLNIAAREMFHQMFSHIPPADKENMLVFRSKFVNAPPLLDLVYVFLIEWVPRELR